MLDGRPLDLAGAVAVCVAPVPAGVGELTWTFGLQATIAAPAARMATGRAKLDFMSDPIGIVGGTETAFASTPEDGTIPMRAERGKKNGSPRGCRSSCLLIWNCPLSRRRSVSKARSPGGETKIGGTRPAVG